MKTRLILLAPLIGAILLIGCQNFPKDAYAKDAMGEVNTPWGPAKWSAKEIATGKAAIEAAKDAPKLLKK
jgi:hypothetical protein